MVNVWNCAAPTELLDLFVPLFSTDISLLRSSCPFHVDSFIIIEFFRLFFHKHHYLINILSSVGANYRYTSHIHLPRPSATHWNWLICKIVLSTKSTPSARGRGMCSVDNALRACQRLQIILIYCCPVKIKIEKNQTKVLDNYHTIRHEARAQARQKAEAAVL